MKSICQIAVLDDYQNAAWIFADRLVVEKQAGIKLEAKEMISSIKINHVTRSG